MKDRRTPTHTTIILNGREQAVTSNRLSFEDLVQLTARGRLPSNSSLFTVTWSHGKAGGSLAPGEELEVLAGMVVNAIRTGNA